MAISFQSKSQNVPLTSLKTTWGASYASGAVFDTIKTTAAVYMYTGPIIGFKDVVNITAVATEISGTTGGTLSLEVSQDGTNWSGTYNSADTIYNLTLADVTTAQVYRWKVLNSGDKYYRVKSVGSGTVVVDIRGTYAAWQRNKF